MLCFAFFEWWEQVECCRVLWGPVPPKSAYYTNLVTGDHSAETFIWHVAALEFDILAVGMFLSLQSGLRWVTTAVIPVWVMDVTA